MNIHEEGNGQRKEFAHLWEQILSFKRSPFMEGFLSGEKRHYQSKVDLLIQIANKL